MQALSFLSFLLESDEEMDLVCDNEHHNVDEIGGEHCSTSSRTCGDSESVKGDLSTEDAKGEHTFISDADTAEHATLSGMTHL